VRDIEVFQVKVNARGNWVIVRVSTNGGVRGLGECSQGGPDEGTLEFVKRFFGLLHGRNVHDIDAFRQACEPEIARGGLQAQAAFGSLEQALWDIRGQLFDVPVFELLGGRVQPKIRVYANINRSTTDRSPEDFARLASKAVKDGYNAVKLAPFDDMPRDLSDRPRIEEFIKLGLARAAAVRQTIGPDRDLLIDVHSHLDVERGLDLLQGIEPLKLFWIEEVTPAKPVSGLAAIRRAATGKMRTAGGELIYATKGFYPYITGGAVDVVMPDVKYCGGLGEMKLIAGLAEGAGLLVSPHSPAGPVGEVAGAHAAATMPNFLILELAYGEVPWRAELLDPPEHVNESLLELSARPGFGVRLNERTAEKWKV
jgi:galactonate dehydratase